MDIFAIDSTGVSLTVSKKGSRGAAIVRFKYRDTSFCFANCRLSGGNAPEN